ncbi:hypothetical protein CPB85DRAFT_1345346, partial [Mucidula mucida]
MRRTGTPPFMAFDLQDPHNLHVLHLYRHDLESLFYVLLMLVCRHKSIIRKVRSSSYDRTHLLRIGSTGACRGRSFERPRSNSSIAPTLRSSNRKFRPAFEFSKRSLWKVLGGGFAKRHQAKTQLSSFSISERLNAAIKAGHIKPPPLVAKQRVDDETLDGEVTYWTFMQYM